LEGITALQKQELFSSNGRSLKSSSAPVLRASALKRGRTHQAKDRAKLERRGAENKRMPNGILKSQVIGEVKHQPNGIQNTANDDQTDCGRREGTEHRVIGEYSAPA
jgi:hypothetical protein